MSLLSEDAKVRVRRYAPHPAKVTPMHSHPATVAHVVKGGRVKYTLLGGTAFLAELNTSAALIRPPATHIDEALDELEVILVELKP